MSRLVSPDSFVRHVPFGFQFRDSSDLALIADGLTVRVSDAARLARTVTLVVTPSGTWSSPVLPGLGADAAAATDQWPDVKRPFAVEVVDSLGRYLPIRFTADLPHRGRYPWKSWTDLAAEPRLAPLRPAGAGEGFVPDYLPLFPAIARTPPGPRATMRAHLAYRETGKPDRPAAWAAVVVSIDGKRFGVGMADGGGAVAVTFPYPALPSQTSEAAAAGRTTVEWQASLEVHHDPTLDGDPPPLEALLAQLASPPVKALAKLGSGAALGSQALVLGRPLTARTKAADGALLSTLYLKPA